MATGNWNVFGYNLPEFGITEKFGGNTNSLQTGYKANSGPTNNNLSSLNSGGNSGSVLGSSAPSPIRTFQSSGGGSSSGGNTNISSNGMSESDYQKELDRQRDKTRDAIKDRAGSYLKDLDRLAGFLPQYEQEDTQFVNQNFDLSLNNLTQAKEGSLNKLDTSRGQVRERKAQSIADLQQDLRNQMNATNMRLGAMGAGNSSAAEIMAPYAYAKLGTQARTQLQNQSNSQLADLDMKEQDVIVTYDTEKTRVEQEKIDALNNIKSYYRDRFLQIENAKSQVRDSEKASLENLQMSLLDDARNRLAQVQAYTLQRNAELESWVRNRTAQLQDMRIQLGQMGDYDVEDLVRMSMPGVSANVGGSEDYQYNPLALMRKRNEEQSYA